MNEILLSSRPYSQRIGELARKAFWLAAGSMALGGLQTAPVTQRCLRIERRGMYLRGLGHDLDGAVVAHITDLHCSPLIGDGFLSRYIDVINEAGADFVVITGDFITTGPTYFARRVARVLGRLRPRIAALACLGNHDYNSWRPGRGGRSSLADNLSDELRRANIRVLRNECCVLRRGGSAVQFVGLEDFWTGRYNPRRAFENAHRYLPTVALCHNPDPSPELADLGAQWILAGHTHGKIDVFTPTSRADFVAGHYQLGDDRHLYISRGVGRSWRIKSDNQPEITLFTLRHAEN